MATLTAKVEESREELLEAQDAQDAIAAQESEARYYFTLFIEYLKGLSSECVGLFPCLQARGLPPASPLLRSMERDCDRIDRLQSECKKHEGQIRDLSSRIVSSYTKTLKQAIEEQGVLQKKFDTVR